ncbi:hypothetical protein GGR53DRAFT_441042 [Hypoxylon sp. FL1150]|nr:hypothetical protein GGR53DRAFT_441042 [Hypoxylon sp. FL1150]
MGWLSFLSRKTPTTDSVGLKAQAYDETVAAKAPIRGTYPITGNGSSILEKFQKSHPHLRNVDFLSDSAPSPTVPRLLERPSTAPNHQSPKGSARPKSQSGTSARILRDPPKKRHGPYRLPPTLPIDGNDSIANKYLYSAPSPTFSRDRNSSIFSADSGSTRRFVDLLDAQSFIKPSDFYGRVKATGAKDYDEEVADRNIRTNGSDRSSMQTQEIDSRNLVFNVGYNDGENNRPLSPSKRHSMGSGLRTRTAKYNLQKTLPEIPILQIPQGSGDNSETTPKSKVSHRKSLHSYVPSSSADRPRSASAKKAYSAEPISFSNSLRDKARAAVRDELERDSCAGTGSENRLAQSPRKAEGVPIKQNTSIETPYYTPTNCKQSLPTEATQQKPTKDRSWRRTISHVSSLATVKSTSSSRRNSLQSYQSTGRKDFIAESNLVSMEELLRERRSRKSSKQHGETLADFDGSVSELPQLRPNGTPQLKPTTSRLSSRDGYHDGKRSVISVSRKSSKRPEVEDLPEQGSSIRRWSLTSETAGSTLSSNPFRPQSGHTTNTSIDLAPRMPLPKPLESKHTPSSSGDTYPVLENRMENASYDFLHQETEPDVLVGSIDNPGCEHSTGFVMEEDALSIDSFDAPQHFAGEFEKDLLFQGYGMEGSQLPGLPGLFDAPPQTPEPTPSRRTKKSTGHKGSFHVAAFSPSVDDMYHRAALAPQYSTRSLQYASRPRSSRLRMPAIRYSDSDSDDNSELGYESEEELNFDIPKTRSTNTSRCYDTRSSSRRRHVPSEIHYEDEDVEFPDAAAYLARLRREEKARQRVVKGKGKAREVGVPRIGLDDPSSYADIDS